MNIEMKKSKWVIMVYMAADDTLANFAIESLKQLRNTATDEVVVAAQFDPDGRPNSHAVRRYVFNGSSLDKPLRNLDKFWGNEKHDSVDMTSPATLTNFMNWVYRNYQAEHYCLILWGHGPELLFELPLRSDRRNSGGPNRLYFTPAQLKNALRDTKNNEESNNLRIIGMDACSMGMVEYAYELQGLADFMVASQEEVPDPSFPYNTLVARFAKAQSSEELCRQGVLDYVKAYQQYFCNESTGMHPVTLAAIKLNAVNAVENPLRDLSAALLSAAAAETAQLIYDARAMAQGYVGGLYVDLHDFCDQLGQQLNQQLGKRKLDQKELALQTACGKVSAAIEQVVTARAGAIQGRLAKPDNPKFRSHGLSIYFPYLEDGLEKKFIEQDLIKGIPRLIDKDTVAAYQQLNAVSISVRYIVRREMIQDIEGYYQERDPNFPDRNFKFPETGWCRFIQQGWSRILAVKEPEADKNPNNLDTRYLARQCVKNLLTIIPPSLPPDEGVGARAPAADKGLGASVRVQ